MRRNEDGGEDQTAEEDFEVQTRATSLLTSVHVGHSPPALDREVDHEAKEYSE